MPDLRDGELVEIQGSARLPYVLKNVAGVYSCSCPAWRNQSLSIDRRTCKHLRQYRGEAAEQARMGTTGGHPAKAVPPSKSVAPAILLAETWNPQENPTGWWLSEKLDGVRAYWDGQRFISRQGNTFHAPAWFTVELPRVPLDGELWLARKAFQRTVSIVRRQDGNDLWREVRYLIFDLPAAQSGFEERLEALQAQFAGRRISFAEVHRHERCRGKAHLQQELARVVALGGEGLMLRQPQSRYEGRRSATLQKLKLFHDAEARILEHQPGAGRHKGRLGALLVELPDGTQFSVGSGLTDAEREMPPPIGCTITFRYQELSDRGVPRFPTFVGVRQDAPA